MTILGPSFVISGLFRGHLLPCWPSRGHLGSILRHFRLTTSEDRRRIADLAKFALRLHESAILSVLASSWNRLGAIFGPSWAVLGPFLLILGPLRATLGRLGPSRREDRRRHSRLCKIRTSLTRDANVGIYGPDLRHLESVLASSSGRLEAIPGPTWGHLGVISAHLGPSWGHFGPSWAVSGREPTTAYPI